MWSFNFTLSSCKGEEKQNTLCIDRLGPFGLGHSIRSCGRDGLPGTSQKVRALREPCTFKALRGPGDFAWLAYDLTCEACVRRAIS